MTESTLRLDPLRERLLRPELERARVILRDAGAHALIADARTALDEVERNRSRLETLAHELETAQRDEQARCVERYLRATVHDRKRLARDLRALRKASAGVLDLVTLGERALHQGAALERRAEAALGLAGAAFRHGARDQQSGPPEAEALLVLARHRGRWSRRTEAIKLLTWLAQHKPAGLDRATLARTAQQLAAPSEQRWVQPVAIELLAAVDRAAAHALLQVRLSSYTGPDDFIVRASIVQRLWRFRRLGWLELLEHAHADPSELVRMTAARVERNPTRIAQIARSDGSPKVRAVALITLRKRVGAGCVLNLCATLDADPDALAVQTAAQELAALARHGATPLSAACLSALVRTAGRTELPASARVACEQAALTISVFSNEATRAAYRALAPSVQTTPVGAASRVKDARLAGLDQAALARVLAALSQEDHALGVDSKNDGLVLHRGERRGFALWRVLFELFHPAPSKRQGFHHTTGRRPRGTLRAPAGGMAELAATRVPGEAVLVERTGGWGRDLPRVDDLLSTGVLRGTRVAVASLRGVTTLLPAPTLFRRLRAFAALSLHYARFSELRQRALRADEPEIQAAYIRDVIEKTGIDVRFAPHDLADAPTELRFPPSPQLASVAREPARSTSQPPQRLLGTALGLLGSRELQNAWQDFLAYATSSGANRLLHLTGYALTLLFGMTLRSVAIRHRIDSDRAAIPLVIGGWGTRGKSGTERLKAALFQGLGHECLVKTTGCEAMFIHAQPDIAAREIFIYRAYDKASVWEQRDVLSLARQLDVRVFLWECMALQPDLVDLLQTQWMRDDLSTITNAYPDHEDVQGPTGFDVATVISEFVPTRGRLFTAEEQMLPLLRERARARGTRLCAVPSRDGQLIASDLLARFPYQEHPNNIALVARMARSLSVDPTQAIVEMADNVVPDLGVLKTYPKVSWLGRTLSFTNGMSANERTGALANWQRAGFLAHDPDEDPQRWIVTVVNNRADRVARSEVFARVIVEDVSAHRHVLIGTNVTGLLGFIRVALDKLLLALSPVRDLAGSTEQQLKTAHARIDRAFARLKLGSTSAASVLREWEALGLPSLPQKHVEALLSPAAATETWAESLQAVTSALQGAIEPEQLPCAASSIARRRALRALHALADRSLVQDPARLDRAFGALYRSLFDASLVPVLDAATSGDAIIETVANHVPKGAHAAIMGLQNIKGTGLDFVYRWVSIDLVERALQGLSANAPEQRERALTQLMLHDDYGMVDASAALAAVSAAQARDPQADALPYAAAVTARLTEVVAVRTQLARTRRAPSFSDRVRRRVGETLDFLDAVRRRGLSRRVLDALVEQQISHATAAIRMREIMARTKGAWLRARS